MDLPLAVSGSPQEPLSFLNLPHHHTYYKAVREGVGCVFSTAVPITKLFARGGGGNGGHVLRETTSRGLV